MPGNLSSLPTELHLLIIKTLRRDEEVAADPKNGKKTGDERKEIQDEPVQIQHDLINWSSTCSYFRALLAPDIFEAIRLVNDEYSGSSLDALARSPHNVQVKALHFIGSALGDAHCEEAAFSNVDAILPRSVSAVLGNLQQFPHLERLSIRFDYNFQIKGEWNDAGVMDLDAEPETPKQVLEAEASTAWRALMSRTYAAVTRNKSHRIKHFEIRQLVWKNVSTFRHASFHDFLGHCEHFTLSIHGEEAIDHVGANMTKEYPALMGKLDKCFFDHLAHVTTLSIKAPKEGPLGLRGEGGKNGNTTLALKAGQMPRLTTLHLDYIMVSPELIDFLIYHKDTLEELRMWNCFAFLQPSTSNGIKWSRLFTALVSAAPTQLRRVELAVDGFMIYFTNEQTDQVRTTLQQNPGNTLFPYVIVCEPYGVLCYDEYGSINELLKGNDQRRWNRLMRLVERNAKKAVKSGSKGKDLQVLSYCTVQPSWDVNSYLGMFSP